MVLQRAPDTGWQYAKSQKSVLHQHIKAHDAYRSRCWLRKISAVDSADDVGFHTTVSFVVILILYSLPKKPVIHNYEKSVEKA